MHTDGPPSQNWRETWCVCVCVDDRDREMEREREAERRGGDEETENRREREGAENSLVCGMRKRFDQQVDS